MMYLFRDQSEVKVPVTCKYCLKKVEFTVTAEEYEKIKEFPITREDVHGEPPHKLLVFINKNLEVENFEIKDILEKKVEYSQELTKQVLSEIELTDEEIELYFLTTGRDAVSLGEMAILIDKTKEECEIIAEKFVDKGLFKRIVGATPHYQALPPYAALIGQLGNFKSFISTIRENVPPQLNDALSELEAKTEGVKELKDYIDFMNNLKQDILSKLGTQKKNFESGISAIDNIKSIGEVVGTLEADTKKIMDSQIDDLNKQFDDIQQKISSNLQKLRLGVIQQTVDQVIQRIFAEGMDKIKERLDEQFSSKIKTLLDPIEKSISTITDSVTKTGDDIKSVFGDISKNFSQTIIMAEENLSGVSGVVFDSFNTLRDTFRNEIIKTLEDVLEKILTRLDVNEKVTAEFWERAKGVTSFTMQDIWFVRSPEGAKAHIEEQISKAKMRLLIVAPNITDVKVEALKAIPRHINIRIAANIERNNADHMNVIAHLEGMENVTYRNRKLQNLWGINRDYEEVILCVISKVAIGTETKTEIAGIGSIIEEHIKIFVPILEEAWVGAQKEQYAVKPIEDVPPPKEKVKKTPTKKVKGTKITPPKIDLKPVEDETKTASAKKKAGKTLSKDQINILFDALEADVDEKTGVEISEALNEIYNAVEGFGGYSSVLDPMKRTAIELSDKTGTLNITERYEIKKKLKFWLKKLYL